MKDRELKEHLKKGLTIKQIIEEIKRQQELIESKRSKKDELVRKIQQ